MFVCAGDEQPGQGASDVVFVIDEKPHPHFKREGNDLFYTHRLPLVEALSGTELKIPHLDGKTISLPIDEVTTAATSHLAICCESYLEAFERARERSHRRCLYTLRGGAVNRLICLGAHQWSDYCSDRH